ncbi:MAG: DUF924 domain-containing protein, partial [Bdellovibrionales bacterium]|nr:DUF924 domain-containing protein [Bdellovibrionales bacterium]
ELEHKEIIERFGRYPHRNKVLGRTTTPEEADFLKSTRNIFESNAGSWQNITLIQKIETISVD